MNKTFHAGAQVPPVAAAAMNRRTMLKQAGGLALWAGLPQLGLAADADGPFSAAAQQTVARYLESLAKPDGGYGWSEQYDSHLSVTFAVVGAYHALGLAAPRPRETAAFVRRGHPTGGPNAETRIHATELKEFVFQQIQSLLWLGQGTTDFRPGIKDGNAWNKISFYTSVYEKGENPVLRQEVQPILCRELLGLSVDDLPPAFAEYLAARRRGWHVQQHAGKRRQRRPPGEHLFLPSRPSRAGDRAVAGGCRLDQPLPDGQRRFYLVARAGHRRRGGRQLYLGGRSCVGAPRAKTGPAERLPRLAPIALERGWGLCRPARRRLDGDGHLPVTRCVSRARRLGRRQASASAKVPAAAHRLAGIYHPDSGFHRGLDRRSRRDGAALAHSSLGREKLAARMDRPRTSGGASTRRARDLLPVERGIRHARTGAGPRQLHARERPARRAHSTADHLAAPGRFLGAIPRRS